MKALITGGAGFAASHLAELLLKKNFDVACAVHDRARTENLQAIRQAIRVLECDVRDAAAMRRLLRAVRPDRLYHLAGATYVPDSFVRPETIFETNLLGTLNVFDTIRALKLKTRILFVGSAEEYGIAKRRELPLRERSALRPPTVYALSKACADLLAHQCWRCFQIDVVRVRPFNHTGPRQSPRFVCSDFARQLVEIEMKHRRPVLHVGDLSRRRDFSDVRDMVRGYFLALEKGRPGEVYNLCSGRAVSIREVLRMLLQTSSKRIQVLEEKRRQRPVDIPILYGSHQKATRELGWRPQIDLTRTLSDLKEYWREKLGGRS